MSRSLARVSENRSSSQDSAAQLADFWELGVPTPRVLEFRVPEEALRPDAVSVDPDEEITLPDALPLTLPPPPPCPAPPLRPAPPSLPLPPPPELASVPPPIPRRSRPVAPPLPARALPPLRLVDFTDVIEERPVRSAAAPPPAAYVDAPTSGCQRRVVPAVVRAARELREAEELGELRREIERASDRKVTTLMVGVIWTLALALFAALMSLAWPA